MNLHQVLDATDEDEGLTGARSSEKYTVATSATRSVELLTNQIIVPRHETRLCPLVAHCVEPRLREKRSGAAEATPLSFNTRPGAR